MLYVRRGASSRAVSSGAHARRFIALQDVTVDGQLCGTIGTAVTVNTVSCGNKVGQAVKVQLPGTGTLTLCEVEVYGSGGAHARARAHTFTHTHAHAQYAP